MVICWPSLDGLRAGDGGPEQDLRGGSGQASRIRLMDASCVEYQLGERGQPL